MQKKIIVVGGGIIGLSCAFYLHQEGHHVTILDQSEMNQGASYVNAGYLTPSHIVPLAAPGMAAKGLKWMFDSSSPFYIQPRLNLDLIDWGMKFMRSCSQKHVNRSLKVIRDVNLFSKELYQDLATLPTLDFHLEDRGLLMVFQTAAAEKEEEIVMKEAKKLGLDVEKISPKKVQELQPDVSMDIAGAYWYRCDAHSTPATFMQQLKSYLVKEGVKIHQNVKVTSLIKKGKTIQAVQTDQSVFSADEIVIATGAWTQKLLQPLGINLPLQAGKGYRLDETQPTGITLPAILMERKVAVTPMKGFTRFSGTMEIAGINHNIRQKRVDAIAHAASQYYPGLKLSQFTKERVKCGLRPLSPDGLPFIGRHSNFFNLTIATGHAMMGWSLGPATGKLVAEVISNQKTSLDLTAFATERRYG